MFRWQASLIAILLFWAGAAVAQESATAVTTDANNPDTEDTRSENRSRLADDVIVVTGSAAEASRVGGSAHFLDEEALEEFNYADINRILRDIPGVNLQEEDGYGLRPNIGLRGTGVDRSSRIALIEDGVPIAPAPYASPSAYYFPRAGRMAGIEVTKGPGAIVYGPLTTGGSIHMLSTPIPEEFFAYADVMGGEDGRFQGHAYLGTTEEIAPGVDAGFLVEAFHDQSDGFKDLAAGDTGFVIDDFVGRFRISFDDLFGVPQSFAFKFQTSEEDSDETYLGLTQSDFDVNPFMRYAGSQLDEMDNEHGIAQFTHTVDLTDSVRVITTAYRTEFQRNWYKLDRVVDPVEGSSSISSILDDPMTYAGAMEILRGASGFTSADDALLVKANNRSYFAQGIQSTVQFGFDAFGAGHELEASLRYHEDAMDRYQWVDRYRMDNGAMVLTTAGVPGTDSNRIESAEAWAGFIRDEISLGRWTVTPGVRFESIDLMRENYGNADPNRTGVALSTSSNSVNVLIPGISATYDVNDSFLLLAGVHRGFTPPGAGSTSDPEDSTNWEAGFRWFGDVGSAAVIAFYSDYDNLLGTCTASTGGNCTIGDQFDGGEVEVLGVEASYDAEFDTPWDGVTAPVRLNYTFTQTEFQTSFDSSYDAWGTVSAGDELPYIPEHQFTVSGGLRTDVWRASLTANYVSETRSVAGRGAIPAANSIDERWVADAAAGWRLTPETELYLRVDNVFDDAYVAARRPAGLRPGQPRTVMVGLRFALGGQGL